MSHKHEPEKDGGVRVIIETLSDVAVFPTEVPQLIICAGKVCDCCGDPSIVLAALGNGSGHGVRISETMKLVDAEALADHIKAEVKRLRDEGHVQKEENHASAAH